MMNVTIPKNKIHPAEVEYITSNITYEVQKVSNRNKQHTFYVYNNSSNHYKVFTSLQNIINHFTQQEEHAGEFETEQELETFLEEYNLDNETNS